MTGQPIMERMKSNHSFGAGASRYVKHLGPDPSGLQHTPPVNRSFVPLDLLLANIGLDNIIAKLAMAPTWSMTSMTTALEDIGSHPRIDEILAGMQEMRITNLDRILPKSGHMDAFHLVSAISRPCFPTYYCL